MFERKISIDFQDQGAREQAAEFLLALVKCGLTFRANQDCDTLIITLEGGY